MNKEFEKIKGFVKIGAYIIYWKEGGSSVAAIGITKSGSPWIAPTNWTFPTAENISDDIDHVEYFDLEKDEPLTEEKTNKFSDMLMKISGVSGTGKTRISQDENFKMYKIEVQETNPPDSGGNIFLRELEHYSFLKYDYLFQGHINGANKFDITFYEPLDKPKTPPKKTTQITKKEYYHIKIGGEDFGDFMVESEWEGMKKLINEDKGLTVIIAIDPVDRIGEILGFSENGIKIVMAHPDISVALMKNREPEEQDTTYVDQVMDCHAYLDERGYPRYEPETLFVRVKNIEKGLSFQINGISATENSKST